MFLDDADRLLEAPDVLHEQEGRLEDYGNRLVPGSWRAARWWSTDWRVYWTDMGTRQSYRAAHMQMLDGDGVTLEDPSWPILSAHPQRVPARITGSTELRGSMAAAGAIVRGAVEHSVLGPGVVEEGATVRGSVLLDGVRVGAGVALLNVVADTGAEIPAGEHGAPGSVTLIDGTGSVSATERSDRSATLPGGF